MVTCENYILMPLVISHPGCEHEQINHQQKGHLRLRVRKPRVFEKPRQQRPPSCPLSKILRLLLPSSFPKRETQHRPAAHATVSSIFLISSCLAKCTSSPVSSNYQTRTHIPGTFRAPPLSLFQCHLLRAWTDPHNQSKPDF